MYQNKKIIAIITARGGSKGIPGKNIKPLWGKPLLDWTFEAAKSSLYLDRIILSTDDNRIIQHAEQLGCEVPFIRPSYLATDEATSTDVILHALDEAGNDYDYFLLLQPTSPFRKSRDIDHIIEACVDKGVMVMVSVEQVKAHPMFLYQLLDGALHSFDPQAQQLRRQDIPPVYKHNGALYIADINHFREVRSFVGKEAHGFICDGPINVDIDTHLDWQYAEFLLEKGLV